MASRVSLAVIARAPAPTISPDDQGLMTKCERTTCAVISARLIPTECNGFSRQKASLCDNFLAL